MRVSQGHYKRFVEYEIEATAIRNYQQHFLPGLLQTEGYGAMSASRAGQAFGQVAALIALLETALRGPHTGRQQATSVRRAVECCRSRHVEPGPELHGVILAPSSLGVSATRPHTSWFTPPHRRRRPPDPPSPLEAKQCQLQSSSPSCWAR